MDRLAQAQLEHGRWATDQLLVRCRALTEDEFRRSFDIGPGSLQATLAHVIEAMFYFADILSEKEYVERDGFQQEAATPDGLAVLLERADVELRNVLSSFFGSHSMSDEVPWSGAACPVTADVALAQVFDHGTHHRAQCIHMLHRLGKLNSLEVHPLRWSGADPA